MSITAPSLAYTGDLQLEYATCDYAVSQPSSWWQGVLGVAGFEKLPLINRPGIPVAASLTPCLNASNLCEVWRVAAPHAPLSSGESAKARVRYRHSDDLLFGALTLTEQVSGARGEADALLRATELAYQEIFQVLESTQHRHLVRIWNYLPQINAQADGEERYRHFNAARQMAFRKCGRATMGTVPAASALGTPAGSPLSIYFLAARSAPRMIENPRQTSAYHYPPKFGRHSPVFSRACVWGDPGRGKLFISGTASIVGHESIHCGNVEAQTRETLVNINALVDEANRIVGAQRYSTHELMLKVYVRNASDLPAVKGAVAEVLGTVPVMVFLQADVCREDLLVEIEAVG